MPSKENRDIGVIARRHYGCPHKKRVLATIKIIFTSSVDEVIPKGRHKPWFTTKTWQLTEKVEEI